MAKFKKASDIKVGVVGYGAAFNMGRKHLQEMQAAGMTPVAVCDPDTARLKVAEEEFPGISTFTTLPAMLKKVDVNLITLITPHNIHAKQALQALNAGCSVCSEKPLAITTAECDAMIAAAKKNDVILTTYHNRHWDGCILEAMDRIVKKGQIGDIVRIECHMGGFGQPSDWWRSSKTISGGVLYDWGVHLLEYSLQLLAPAKIKEVMGLAKTGHWQTKWGKDTNEDEGLAVVRFNTGQWLSLSITNIDANSKSDRGQLEITGTKGSYIMNQGDYRIVLPGKKETKTLTGRNRPGQQHLYYQNVADHLVKGETLTIDGAWSRRPIHILDLADKSAKAGRAQLAKYE